MVRLARNYLEEMVAHAREGVPNEVCGILAGRDGQAVKLYRTKNADESPLTYRIAPRDLLHALREIEEQEWEVFGIYHSHTHSPAYPSATDVRLAFYPEALYFIVSLADPENPVLRAFLIDRDATIGNGGGKRQPIQEVAVEIAR